MHVLQPSGLNIAAISASSEMLRFANPSGYMEVALAAAGSNHVIPEMILVKARGAMM